MSAKSSTHVKDNKGNVINVGTVKGDIHFHEKDRGNRKHKNTASVFAKYKDSVFGEHRHLTMQGFETNLRIPIELDRVYINMRAHIHAHDHDNTVFGKEKWLKKVKEENLSSMDIRGAFSVARNRGTKNMVILGDPGSGKTTLMKYILVMLLTGKGEEKLGLSSDLVPFFAPLNKLKNPDEESFTAFIKRVCCLDKYGIEEDDFKQLHDAKKGIILLDGLDEVADTDTRIRTCKWVDEASKEFVYTPFILTSRLAGYYGKSRLQGSSLELAIQDFTFEEVTNFLIRWFETVEVALHPEDGNEESWKLKGRESAENLIHRIEEAEHIKKLAVNPLMLQIIALVHRDRGRLPQRRVELYDECTNVFLGKRDMETKGLGVLLTAKESRQVLQPVAFWLHEEDGRRCAPLDEIVPLVRDALETLGKEDLDPFMLLNNIRDRSGIFMGYNETEYGFTHLSFQEYLAAEQVRNIGKIELLVEKYGQRWWREVILLFLALDNPSMIDQFMEKIVETKQFLKEIDLLESAVDDSIQKPRKVLQALLEKRELSKRAKENIQLLLDHIQGKRRSVKVSGRADITIGVTSTVKGNERIITNSKDGSRMVLIPAGTFLYGSKEDDKQAGSDEKPQRTIHLPDYYMDVYPVTNEQFCEFLNQTNPDSGQIVKWINLTGKYEKEKCRIGNDGKKSLFAVQKGYDSHPVIYVSWHGADAYAKWAGKKLPTEQEWEKAARGTDGRIYPWGDEFDGKRCNFGSKAGGTTPVGHYPGGVSPYGCHDMAGNVWDWTSSFYCETDNRYVLCGGSWNYSAVYCRCACRYVSYPGLRSLNIGFRCSRI